MEFERAVKELKVLKRYGLNEANTRAYLAMGLGVESLTGMAGCSGMTRTRFYRARGKLVEIDFVYFHGDDGSYSQIPLPALLDRLIGEERANREERDLIISQLREAYAKGKVRFEPVVTIDGDMKAGLVELFRPYFNKIAQRTTPEFATDVYLGMLAKKSMTGVAKDLGTNRMIASKSLGILTKIGFTGKDKRFIPWETGVYYPVSLPTALDNLEKLEKTEHETRMGQLSSLEETFSREQIGFGLENQGVSFISKY